MKDYALSRLILGANLLKGRVLKFCPSCGWNTSHANPIEDEYKQDAIDSLLDVVQHHELYCTDVVVMTVVQHVVDVIPFEILLLDMTCKQGLTNERLARKTFSTN